MSEEDGEREGRGGVSLGQPKFLAARLAVWAVAVGCPGNQFAASGPSVRPSVFLPKVGITRNDAPGGGAAADLVAIPKLRWLFLPGRKVVSLQS